jgi:hypothetical protein
MNLSVIVCTHNARRDFFDRCLAALRAQTLPPESWDLLIVDNRSAPPVVSAIDLSWHLHARVASEPVLGLTPARLCGIRECRGDLLIFVDDDNLLAPDYLQTAVAIAEAHPFLGAWSGQCLPEFESPPPEWTRRYWGSLVIREFDRDVWSNLPRLPDSMPCGAGLCVRRRVAEHYLHLHNAGKRSFQLDRAGTSLLSGGDNDLAGCACDIGMGVGLMTSLKLTHLIPRVRLTEDYLARLLEGIAFSSMVLDFERGLTPRRRGFMGSAADFIRMLRATGKDRAMLRAVYRGRDRAINAILSR